MRIQKLTPPVIAHTPVRVFIRNCTGDVYSQTERKELAFDVLLPLAPDQLRGGLAAHEALGTLLLRALQPYRKPEAPERAPAKCFDLLRCTVQGMRLPGCQYLDMAPLLMSSLLC